MAKSHRGETRGPARPLSLEFHPLTPDRWNDFETLFGEHGAYGGCWCMWWRSTRAQFQKNVGEGNRRAMRALVVSGEVPGLLAYAAGKPAAWCSVAPREKYPSLNRSRVLKPVDGTPVWSLVCFYVDKEFRGQGMSAALIDGVIDHVKTSGGSVIEAYPTDPKGRRLPPVSSYMGTPAVFATAGFTEHARPSEAKVIMRYRITKPYNP